VTQSLTEPVDAVKETVAPHPYEIVKTEAFKLLFTLNGQTPRPETGLILMWLMSHNWPLVSDRETAERAWNDLSLHGEGQPVKEAVDFIVEFTMRVIAELHYHGIFQKTRESFLLGQSTFCKSQSVHSHLKERLPYSKLESVHSNVQKTPFSNLNKSQHIDYTDLIDQEPWIMACVLLVRSGVLQEIDQRLDKARNQKGNK